MARIRSVKPEFWSDPDIVDLPMAARLFFIGTWNHADDFGVLKDEPARLKMQILPNDAVDPYELVEELVQSDLLQRKVASDGTNVLVIRTFCVHQKIDKRSEGRWGNPEDFTEAPPIPTNPSESPRTPTDPALGFRKGRELVLEGTGTEGTSSKSRPRATANGHALEVVNGCAPEVRGDVEQVFGVWVKSTGKHPTRTVLDPKRRRLIVNALKRYPLDDTLDAVTGWEHSAHHRGENDTGTAYNDLGLLLRDPEHIEKFRDLRRGPPEVKRNGTPTRADDNRSKIERSLARMEGRDVNGNIVR